MKLFMIAKSNIKKNRSMSITLLILIFFASILLYVGTSVVLNLKTFLNEKNNEYNGSDFIILAPIKYDDLVKDILKDMGDYSGYEKVASVTADTTFENITKKEKRQSIGCVLLNADKKETIAKMKIIDKGDKKLPNSIILPYYLKVTKGYKTGEEIAIAYEGKSYNYTIYGFAEDIMFATPSNISYYKCYVFEDAFNKIYEENKNTQFSLVKLQLEKGVDKGEFNDRFVKSTNDKISGSTSDIISADVDSMKVGVSIFLIIIMAVFIAFSIIILLISLTVTRFAIVTYIEGNMKNIGSMEALGYTGKELIGSTILQFVTISAISILLGLAAAVSSTGIVTNLVSSSIGLVWNSKINPIAIVINVVVILTAVVLISYLTAAKLKKITPIIALREGINTHNFKKNYFPLDKSSLQVNAVIGLKTLMQNMKQNITIMIIVSLMSFVCVLAFTSNYNFNVDNTAVLKLVGIEKSHLMVTCLGEDSKNTFSEIDKMENVRKTVRLSRISMTAYLGDREITPVFTVCNDFSKLDIKTIVKGRYPIHDNEIAVTGLVLNRLKAEIGDVISVGSNELKKDFIIVGVNQQISNLGKGACITEEGMKRINSSYITTELLVYLNNSNHILSVKNNIENKFSNVVITNMEEQFETTLEAFNKSMIGLCSACILITFGIITLVLYLLIKIKLIKERLRIGVNKAIGYTTRQIIIQLIISFCPVCILGALVGTVFATYLVNPTFVALLSVSGINNCHLTIDPLSTLLIFLAISVFSVVITAVVARSVRKITPRELFL